MTDFSPWSLHLGRFHRVRVSVHAIFVAVAVFVVFLAASDPADNSPVNGILAVTILFSACLRTSWAMASRRHAWGGIAIRS